MTTYNPGNIVRISSDIQLHDGFSFSPVLHFDEWGEDAIEIIDKFFRDAAMPRAPKPHLK